MISYFPNVINAIDKEFSDFMLLDNLSQSIQNREHYREDKYQIYFFHDFDAYHPLAVQYDDVKKKYDRRIKRFLNTITAPTLFIRYISSEEKNKTGKSVELEWIENNFEYILCVLKRFNANNQIMFIGDETIISEKIKVYYVPIDKGDRVSRQPILNNKELFPMLVTANFPGKEKNIAIYKHKPKKEDALFQDVYIKFVDFIRHFFVRNITILKLIMNHKN